MYQIYHNIKIDARMDKVFKYCTDPTHINNWWTKRCTGVPDIDEEYMFWFAPEYDWRAKVTDLIENKRIAFTFYQADRDWTGTVLCIEVEELEEDQTLLHLRHKNWKEDNEHYGRTNYCWAMYLMTLQRYVEIGTVIDYEKRGGI